LQNVVLPLLIAYDRQTLSVELNAIQQRRARTLESPVLQADKHNFHLLAEEKSLQFAPNEPHVEKYVSTNDMTTIGSARCNYNDARWQRMEWAFGNVADQENLPGCHIFVNRDLLQRFAESETHDMITRIRKRVCGRAHE